MNYPFPHTQMNSFLLHKHTVKVSKSFCFSFNPFSHFIFIHFSNLHQNQKGFFLAKFILLSSSSLFSHCPQQVVQNNHLSWKREGRWLSEWFLKFWGMGPCIPPPLVIAMEQIQVNNHSCRLTGAASLNPGTDSSLKIDLRNDWGMVVVL